MLNSIVCLFKHGAIHTDHSKVKSWTSLSKTQNCTNTCYNRTRNPRCGFRKLETPDSICHEINNSQTLCYNSKSLFRSAHAIMTDMLVNIWHNLGRAMCEAGRTLAIVECPKYTSFQKKRWRHVNIVQNKSTQIMRTTRRIHMHNRSKCMTRWIRNASDQMIVTLEGRTHRARHKHRQATCTKACTTE